MLQEGIHGEMTPAQHKPIQGIIGSTNYLTEIVNDLLDQAHLEAGKVRLMKDSFAPASLIQTIHEKMNVLATAKGLTITCEISEQLPARLLGDPTRIQQILVNLLSNAIKFTQSGSIHINIQTPDHQQWVINVSDTGSGIPLEAQGRIFEPFGQVDSSATRNHGGTGLGLSIVKQLTELMDGHISLVSQEPTSV
jgi:signal transduction histidine kinase